MLEGVHLADSEADYAAFGALVRQYVEWCRTRFAQDSWLIDEALSSSPTLAVAQARVRKAEALTAQQRAADLPHLSATAGVQEMKQRYNLGITAEFVQKG